MPRSSKHKSSKHSSRSAKDYSDSEDSGLKEKRSSSAKVAKDSASSEKRKLDSKEAKDHGGGNVEYVQEYSSSSKRRKENNEDGVSERWNGSSDEDSRAEGSKKSSKLIGVSTVSESKSRRREDSSLKSEGKHREASRKERHANNERERTGKRNFVDNTEEDVLDEFQSPELDNLSEKRSRRRDGSGSAEKQRDDDNESNYKRVSSRDSKQKSEKRKDERCKEKYQEEAERDNRDRDERQGDEHQTRYNTSSKSDDKLSRDEKENIENRQRKTKTQDADRHDRENDNDRERDMDGDQEREHHRDVDYFYDRDRGRGRDRDRDYGRNRSRDYDHSRDRDGVRDRDYDRDDDRDHDYDRKPKRDRDHGHDREHDRFDERGTKYKDSSRGKKRSPDDRDDLDNPRPVKSHYSDRERKSLSSGRVEPDAERGRSHSLHAHMDTGVSGTDEYRHMKSEDAKYRDYGTEQRQRSRERTGYSGGSERGSRYRSMDKSVKMDDGHLGETEKSSSTKASPKELVEQSPSTSFEHRYVNRTSVRRSLDVDETGRRSVVPIDARDFPVSEERYSRDLTSEKHLIDESSQVDSAIYGRTSQRNPSPNVPASAFRAGGGSPMGSLEEDGRTTNNSRFRRSSDPNVVRAHGNTWRGIPNWSSPAPNGFLPFPHGPPHGGFQAIIPQFPTPPMFGVRPSMDINHSGFPYNVPDADRFATHMRPLGWQNMMDGSGPSHLHGWEGSNSIFRDELHMYGGPEWEQNRQSLSARGWESGSDVWKGQNGEVNRDFPPTSQKEDFQGQGLLGDASVEQVSQRSEGEVGLDGTQVKALRTKPSASPVKEASNSPHDSTYDTMPSSPRMSHDVLAHYAGVYLSNLDISKELAQPELYVECMGLAQSATADDELKIVEKDGESAGAKISSSLLCTSVVPPKKESVFQRALDLYKQCVESRGSLLNKHRALDTILATCKKSQLTVSGEEKPDGPLSTSTEDMSNLQLPTSDQNKVEALSDADAQDMGGCLQEPSQGLPIPPGSEESKPFTNGEELEKVSSEQVKITPDGEDVGGTSKIKCYPSSCSTEERQNIGDTMSGLLYSDGSSKACEALMPGTKESESVNLHQIHHSPESTH